MLAIGIFEKCTHFKYASTRRLFTISNNTLQTSIYTSPPSPTTIATTSTTTSITTPLPTHHFLLLPPPHTHTTFSTDITAAGGERAGPDVESRLAPGTGENVPKAQRLVPRAGDDALPVRGHGQVQHTVWCMCSVCAVCIV